MNTRIRSVNELAVKKTLSFLEELKFLLDDNRKFNSSELQQQHEISKSTFSICKKLKFIHAGKWIVDEPNRIHALGILEVLRQQASKRVDMVISDDFTTAIERLTTSMNILSTQNEKSLKSPLLSRDLQQSEMNNTNLFSQVESKEAKLFELVKAIARGIYQGKDFHDLRNGHIVDLNELIINAAKDLLSKL